MANHFKNSIAHEFRAEIDDLTAKLNLAVGTALGSIDEKIALPPNAEQALASLTGSFPETGCGMAEALDALLEYNEKAGANTGGPRCYHFVIGGSTPAAMGADLLATLYETVTYTWLLSPVGVQMELQALQWLREMLGLPSHWSGVMVTGASMANLVCLASARQWWGEEMGTDIADQGLVGLPQMPVLSSGYVHASSRKMLGILGVGYNQVSIHARDAVGRVDLDSMRRQLEALDGAPAVVIVNAGEVNAGDFDPVNEITDLARQHNTWVHVDGAFGLFARLSPRTAHLVEGVERADSATVDGHKWLNVPYDSGYAFVRDHELMAKAFRYAADYLPAEDDPRPTPGAIGPESSRRGRSFAVWATLKAYGREGHQRLIEHCLDIAQYTSSLVEQSPHLELMAPVQLNIVPFRFVLDGLDDEALDNFNQRLGEAVLADGRFLVGTSRLGPRSIFRPAFSNWRTRPQDIDEFIEVVCTLGQQLEG
jgi:glutamate/tyrosine decarboxylase-like PLP-dependent enzyme